MGPGGITGTSPLKEKVPSGQSFLWRLEPGARRDDDDDLYAWPADDDPYARPADDDDDAESRW